MSSFPSAAQGDRTLVKAWCRLLGQPAESGLTPDNILAPHRECTLRRLQREGEPKLFDWIPGEPLEWLLVTNVAVRTRQDGARVPGWYRLRWRVEDRHRVLKSGCKVEDLANRRSARWRSTR